MRLPLRRRLTALLAVLVLGWLPVPDARALPFEYSATYFPSGDGTSLHAEVFLPDDRRGRVPVVLLVSPYLTGGGSLAYREFDKLLDRGYAIVQVSLRGFGASGGCGDMGGAGEQADAKAAVEWAAKQSWSTGRVGMWGVSYDGWTQVMALATRPKGLAATVIQSPLASLYRGLYMNGAHYGAGWLATVAAYGVFDLLPPDEATGTQGRVNAVTGTATGARCYATNQTETANPDSTTAYWRERELVPRASTSRVPVLWSHGFADANTKPDNLTALYPLLRGPKRAWVGHFGHSYPGGRTDPDATERYVKEAFDWLDAHVKGDPAARRRVARQAGAVIQRQDGLWRHDDAWGPRDATPATFTLRSGSFVDIGTNDGSQGHDEGAVHWTFSQRLPYAVHLSGAPRVTLTARGAGPAQVVVKVYDVGPEGEAVMVTRGAHAFVSGKVSFDLYPQDWVLEPGHRIGVAVLGSDGTWWSASAGGAQVAISGASLRFPALRYERDRFLFGEDISPRQQFRVEPGIVQAGQATFRLPPKQRRR